MSYFLSSPLSQILYEFLSDQLRRKRIFKVCAIWFNLALWFILWQLAFISLHYFWPHIKCIFDWRSKVSLTEYWCSRSMKAIWLMWVREIFPVSHDAGHCRQHNRHRDHEYLFILATLIFIIIMIFKITVILIIIIIITTKIIITIITKGVFLVSHGARRHHRPAYHHSHANLW